MAVSVLRLRLLRQRRAQSSVRTLGEEHEEALLISSKGQAIRVGLKDIPTLGRTTQGVRIMKMGDDDSVASVGLMAKQDQEDEASAEGEG